MTLQRLAIQGNPGSYAHVAAQQLEPAATILFYPSFAAAMAAVEAGTAEAAVIPIENSSMGRVADIHPLLPVTTLKIAAEHYLPVRHCLLALPGVTLAELKTAHSQLPALLQCQATLQRLGLAPIATADTALAAKELAARGDRSAAAVASRLAGELYGLTVLQEPLNDHAHNTTRFVVFAPQPRLPAPTAACKTSLLFRVQDQAGALYQALAGFAAAGVNLTKLESYIDTTEGRFALAECYVEIEGHPENAAVAAALQHLAKATQWVRLMGTYTQAAAPATAEKVPEPPLHTPLPRPISPAQTNALTGQ
jgi:prephenate dehydratase